VGVVVECVEAGCTQLGFVQILEAANFAAASARARRVFGFGHGFTSASKICVTRGAYRHVDDFSGIFIQRRDGDHVLDGCSSNSGRQTTRQAQMRGVGCHGQSVQRTDIGFGHDFTSESRAG
jgi:hypothetical protein